MSWESYPSAAKMRDIIKRIATSVVDELRPPDKVGRVIDMDRGSMFAWVVYAGDEANPIKVKMLPGKQPQSSDTANGSNRGAIVRVSGSIGSRYISEIMSEAAHVQFGAQYNPKLVSGGAMVDSLYSYFTFATTGVPSPGGWYYYTAVLNFPNWGGQIDIYTEARLSNRKSWIMHERIQFDDTTGTNADLNTTLLAQSSTGMNMSTKFVLYDGAIDGEPAGSAGVTMSLLRDTSSTKNPVSLNVLIKCFGTNIKLVRVVDGESLSA